MHNPCVMHAMDTNTSSSVKKLHETETRLDRTREDMLNTMIANAYLGDGKAIIDLESIDRASILVQLKEKINDFVKPLKPIDAPDKFDFGLFGLLDNYIALFNTISAYNKKITNKPPQPGLMQYLLNSVWYSLPFTARPHEDKFVTKIKLPIEQQRILATQLKSDANIPATETLKLYFESQLTKNDNTSEVTNYTWHDKAALSLPATFCNGLVKLTLFGGTTPIDMAPTPQENILPATQYWQYNDETTLISDDTTHTEVKIPDHYPLFDASPLHFVGVKKDSKTINVFKLPHRVREYEVFTTKNESNNSVGIQDVTVIAATKPTLFNCTHTIKHPVRALIACQQTSEIVYSAALDDASRNNDTSQIHIQTIKKPTASKRAPTLSHPISITITGTINQIVQLDCFNFICLTRDGLLHRVTKNFDKDTKKSVLQSTFIASDAKFSRIAVDQKTNLCALIQAGIDHKDALYTIDKNVLKGQDSIENSDLQKIEAKNPFDKNLAQYEDTVEGQIKCFETSGTIAPTLQCCAGTIIAWYPDIIIGSGQLSKWGNQILFTRLGKYPTIKAFKTNFSVKK